MLTLNKWQKLLDYYIECIDRERLQSTTFKQTGIGTVFYSNLFDKEDFISNSNTTINIPLDVSIGNFILEKRFRGRTNKLYYVYPWVTDGEGNINPLFYTGVYYKIDGKELILSKRNVYPDFNYSVLSKEGLIYENIYRIVNEIDREQRERDRSIPEEKFFVSLVQKSLLNTSYEDSHLIDPLNLDKIDFSHQLVKTIYNQPLLFWGEEDYYVKGLLQELEQLKKEEYHNNIDNTALAFLLGKNFTISGGKFNYLYQVLPLNSSQEEAIQDALNEEFTVVTGPPGTGKSQVLVNTAVNALIHNKKILFASRNNKAVDVVYERLDKLTPESYVIRSGSRDYRKSAFETLKRKANKIKFGYNKSKFLELQQEANMKLKKLKDLEDTLKERLALENSLKNIEPQYNELKDKFNYFIFEKKPIAQIPVENYQEIVNLNKRIRTKNYTIIETLLRIFNPKYPFNKVKKEFLLFINKLDRPLQKGLKADTTSLDDIQENLNKFEGVEKYIEIHNSYIELITKLGELDSVEELESDIKKILDELFHLSAILYSEKWIYNLAEASPNKAIALQDFIAAQQEIYEEKPYFTRSMAKIKRKSMELMKNILDILPIWGVTNLAAKGSIPLSAGLFDELIIDEASQCDIPSVIPLLYRSKSATIIGDPQQLIHVSSLTEKNDKELAEKYELGETYLDYSYKKISLYEIATKRFAKRANPIMLRGHYRSHPEIINFSNREFYGEGLQILTRIENFVVDRPGIEWINVEGRGVRKGPGQIFNIPEAERTIEVLLECLNKFKNRISYGVVSPFRKQVNILNSMLKDFYKKNKVNFEDNLDLTIDTAHGFQGDEKDLVIFSPVIAPGLPKGTVDFANEEHLLNVAITRPRQKLIIVGDFEYALKTKGHIKNLANYVLGLNKISN